MHGGLLQPHKIGQFKIDPAISLPKIPSECRSTARVPWKHMELGDETTEMIPWCSRYRVVVESIYRWQGSRRCRGRTIHQQTRLRNETASIQQPANYPTYKRSLRSKTARQANP